LSELPIQQYPDDFLDDVARTGHLIVVEEHVAQGGVGHSVAAGLLAAGVAPRRFQQFNALGYVSGLYGSQKFHRKECALDAESILKCCAGAVIPARAAA
jgi:transketolase